MLDRVNYNSIIIYRANEYNPISLNLISVFAIWLIAMPASILERYGRKEMGKGITHVVPFPL